MASYTISLIDVLQHIIVFEIEKGSGGVLGLLAVDKASGK
jgi:hypothetical protein